jgi:hypothetical protein
VAGFPLYDGFNSLELRQQGWVVAEPAEFQPFDLEALKNSADSKPIRSSSRREAYVPQIA